MLPRRTTAHSLPDDKETRGEDVTTAVRTSAVGLPDWDSDAKVLDPAIDHTAADPGVVVNITVVR